MFCFYYTIQIWKYPNVPVISLFTLSIPSSLSSLEPFLSLPPPPSPSPSFLLPQWIPSPLPLPPPLNSLTFTTRGLINNTSPHHQQQQDRMFPLSPYQPHSQLNIPSIYSQIRSRITVVCAEVRIAALYYPLFYLLHHLSFHIQCKRLKLKCDRRNPCGSCTKRDTVARCVYSPAAAEKVCVYT